MQKLKLHSPDLTAENIDRLAELFPSCVTEAADENGKLVRIIDFDQLRQELSDHLVDGPRERYQLTWPGKRAALLTANAPIAKTLRPHREESVSFDSTKNLFIEGDNLDALKLLQETYLGRVKAIYIDPPYNTGNDFLYNDDFSATSEDFLVQSNQMDSAGNKLVANTESNGRFHSDWLSMLYPRIRLAKNLLRHDGIIFISIDDSEQHNLRKICDEIFGEDNFVCCFVRRRRMATGMRDTAVSPDHEYVLAYARNVESVKLYGFARNESDYPFSDSVSAYRSTDLTVGMTKEMRPNQFYAVRHPIHGTEYWPPDERVWRFEPTTMAKHVSDDNIIWPDDNPTGRMTRPRFKTRYVPGEEKTNPVSSWIQTASENSRNGENVGALVAGLNQDGTKEVRELFGTQILEYPKPLSLVRGLINISSRDDDIVVDFFAGSGTTGHAVWESNLADGGKRRFILVQLPEPTGRPDFQTVAELTKERIRRAGKKAAEENAQGKDLDIGFRVLKVDSSNMRDVYYSPDEVRKDDLFDQVDNIREGRTAEDLLFQVLLDWGVDLSLPISKETIAGKTVFFVDENALAACFDQGVSEDLVKEIAARHPLRVVLRDNGFASDAVKINVEQIFKLLAPETDVKSI